MSNKLEAKQKNELLKEIAKAYYMGNVLDGNNHEKYAVLAERAVSVAEAFVDAMEKAMEPETDKVDSAK